MTTQPHRLAIFRAGSHVASDGKHYTFSEADLHAIAEGYDPGIAEAPLVVGHPTTDAPAYGWAKALNVQDGVLYAEPHQVEPQFAELVNAGRMKKISASIYLADTPGNPRPGKPYLKHIGFLGAQAPAVKGLASAQFNDGGAAPEFAQPMSALGWSLRDLFQRMRDWMIERDGVEAADRVIPQYQINAIDDYTTHDDGGAAQPAFAEHQTTETDMSEQTNAAEFAEREAQLTTRQTDIEQREQALRDREATARRQDLAEFADGLVQSGQLLPRQRNGVVELLLALPVGTVLNFSQAEGEAATEAGAEEVLRELLSSLPKQLDFSEKSGDRQNGTRAADFATPNGEPIDASRMEIHRKAVEFQQAHPDTSYLAAVKAVGG